MKNIYHYICIAAFLLGGATLARGQSVLRMQQMDVVNLPDTVAYGDTIRNMTVTVINDGPLPLPASLINVQGLLPTVGGIQTGLGSLQLLNFLPVNDSIVIPLDDYIISNQNSNTGSNIVIIWPTSPSTQPGDSLEDDYYVEEGDPTSVEEGWEPMAVQIGPNPCENVLRIKYDEQQYQIQRLQVRDSHGRIVYRKEEFQDQIDTQLFEAGLYFLELFNQHDLKRVVPFVKHH